MVEFRMLACVFLFATSIAAVSACGDTVPTDEPTSLALAVTFSVDTAIDGVEAFIVRDGPDGTLIAGTDAPEPKENFQGDGRFFSLDERSGTQVYVLVNCFVSDQIVASDDGDGELIALVAGRNTVSRTCITHDRDRADVSVVVDTRQAINFDSFLINPVPGTTLPCNSGDATVDFTLTFNTTVGASSSFAVTAGDHLDTEIEANVLAPPVITSPYNFTWTPNGLTSGHWVMAYDEIDGAGEAALFLVTCEGGTGTVQAPTFWAMPKYHKAPVEDGGAIAALYDPSDNGLVLHGYAYGHPNAWYDPTNSTRTMGQMFTPMVGTTFSGLWRDTEAQVFKLTFVDDAATSNVNVADVPYYFGDPRP